MAFEEAFEPPRNTTSAVRPWFRTAQTRIRLNAARSVQLAHGGCASCVRAEPSLLGRSPPPEAD